MILPKRSIPESYFKKTNYSQSSAEALPFYVKECGFLNDRKFTLGNSNNYSDYLLLYVNDGFVRYTKNKNTQYIPPNSVIVTACNTPLVFTRTTKEWNFFYIIIGGTHAKLYYNLIRNNSNVILVSPLSPVLDYFISTVNLDFATQQPHTNMNSSFFLHNILHELYQITYSVNRTMQITPFQENVVNTALRYINENYRGDLDIDTICNKVSFSKYYFCKIFKEHVGITIHQYVNEFRVNKSKELLTYSKLSISAIATSVGFKNTLTYSRAFERSMHMTPSEYRKYF